MISYQHGDLLKADVDALVNTVNELGVMGKGIALQFREHFGASAAVYQKAAKAGQVTTGRMFVTENAPLVKPHWIIHFPTKKHWRNPSKMEWVRDGLIDLVRVIRELGIRSIAIPPLGSGNGGLDWPAVRTEIETALSHLDDVQVLVFEPTDRYYSAPKQTGVESLTIPRALISELVHQYSVLGFECSILEIQKLAWFLTRVIDRLHLPNSLDLNFVAHKYGPYAEKLRFLLDALDGSFLHSEKRLADAGPLDPIWHEPAKVDAVMSHIRESENGRYQEALDVTASVIRGFESPFGMELLATVDWLLFTAKVEPTVEGLRGGLAAWPSASAASRKLQLFDERTLGLALSHLRTVLPEDNSTNRMILA